MDKNDVNVISDLGLFFKYGGQDYVHLFRDHVSEKDIQEALNHPDLYRHLGVLYRYHIGTREDKLPEPHEAEVEEILNFDLKKVIVLKKKDK